VRTKNKTEPEVSYVDPSTRKDINYNRYNSNSKLSDRVSNKMRFLSPPNLFKMNEENHLQKLGQHESHLENIKKNEYIENYEKLKLIKKSWKEGLYPQFMNMSLKELNDFVGFSRNKEELMRTGREDFRDQGDKIRFRQGYNKQSQEKNFTFHNSTKEDLEDKFKKLPKNFDWKDKLKPTESQGGCGSCYAYAAMRMLEARIKILFDDDVKLSVQHALDCSYYNQGCKGGYSFLVFKFSQDFELVPEDCHPYNAKIGKCADSCDVSRLDFPYTVESFSYLGGGYGRTDETMMMEELYKNGPFVVSIEPDADFVYYQSGIYSSINNITWVTQGISPPEWRKVDHSVLLVGWGEDEETKEKYWLIQNSWGINWGEHGYFKIKRGTDELHVESMGEIATPGLKDKYKQEYIFNPLNVKHMKKK
jgi:cathepsin C